MLPASRLSVVLYWILGCFLVLCSAALAGRASAQGIERPSEIPLELPEIRQDAPPILPQVQESLPAGPGPGAGPGVEVREIRVQGNSVLSQEELDAITRPYVGRVVSAADLQRLRNELTLAYVQKGFVNSGALLPDQRIDDGIVEFRIVEGKLTQIDLEIEGRLREDYLRSRLQRSGRGVLDAGRLERGLQLLLQDPRIERIDAQLRPGDRLGEARLELRVEEARPWSVGAEANNHEAPSVGSWEGTIWAKHLDLLGFADALGVEYSRSEGLDEVSVDYAFPVTALDTRLEGRFRYGSSVIVEEPFEPLEIESRSFDYTIGIAQPLFRNLHHQLESGIRLELRENQNQLLGRDFSFDSGSEDGRSQASVLRWSLDYTYRDRHQAFGLRSLTSWGLDAFGATVHSNSLRPDGEFLAWLGQAQYARRFDPWGVQLILRGDLQLADDILLPMEQFSVGGRYSVRGYRRNRWVRDQGWSASAEVRIPLWRGAQHRSVLELAPFFDLARSWNEERPTTGRKSLMGAGVGLRWMPLPYVLVDCYWGENLKSAPPPLDDDLQDESLYFSVSLGPF